MWGGGGQGRFPTTHWSLVQRAGQDDRQARREALEDLLRRYLPALRAHLVYGRHQDPEESEDLLQDFVVAKILERELLEHADRQRGKFRTYLLTALDRFLIDRIRERDAKKRAATDGNPAVLGDHAEQIAGPAVSDAFDIAWARGVIAQAVERMRLECETSGRADVWGVFECRVLDPILTNTEPTPYDELVQRFGLRSPSQASNVLMTGKRTFARVLQSVVGEYTQGEQEIEAEIADLNAILARSRV